MLLGNRYGWRWQLIVRDLPRKTRLRIVQLPSIELPGFDRRKCLLCPRLPLMLHKISLRLFPKLRPNLHRVFRPPLPQILQTTTRRTHTRPTPYQNLAAFLLALLVQLLFELLFEIFAFIIICQRTAHLFFLFPSVFVFWIGFHILYFLRMAAVPTNHIYVNHAAQGDETERPQQQ